MANEPEKMIMGGISGEEDSLSFSLKHVEVQLRLTQIYRLWLICAIHHMNSSVPMPTPMAVGL